MLPATVRMRRREEFAATQRRGRRIGQRTLVVHARTPDRRTPPVSSTSGFTAPTPTASAATACTSTGSTSSGSRSSAPAATASTSTATMSAGPRVGFVVGRAVGNSVIRHRVQRQLRHIVRDRLAALPSDVHLVIRALPAAAGQSSARLAADFDAAVERLGSARGKSRAKSGPRPPR